MKTHKHLNNTLGMFLPGIVLIQPVSTQAAVVLSNLGSGDSFGTMSTSFGFEGSQIAYSFSAVWLFGSGLIGSIGVVRSKANV